MDAEGPALMETPAPVIEGEVSRVSQAARSTVWLALNNWLSKGIQALTLLVIAREFSPSDVGVLSAAVLIITVIAIPGIGFSAALTYRPDRVKEAARTALTIALMVGAGMTITAWLLAPTFARFFHTPQAVGILRGMTSVIICYTAADIPMTLMGRDLDFRRRFIPDVVSSAVGGALSIALVLAGFGVAGVVIGQIAQAVLMVGLYFIVGTRIRPGWDRVLAGQLIGYGWKTSGAAVLQIVVLNVDYIIVGRVLGPRSLGFYSLAFRLCYLPYLVLTNVVTAVAFPYYCRLPSRDQIGPETARISAAIVLITVPLFTGLFLMAGHIVLLGSRWAPAAGVVRALAVYGLLLSLVDSAMASLRALGRPGLTLIGRLLHLVALATIILLTVRRGITAVGIDQALVAGGLALFCLGLVRRESHFGISVAMPFLLPAAAGAVAMVVAFSGAQRLVPHLGNPASLPGGVVLSLAGAVAYVLVAGALGRRTLQETLRQVRSIRTPVGEPLPSVVTADRGA
jgi:O-antigen/teichoic acid export membrane protein